MYRYVWFSINCVLCFIWNHLYVWPIEPLFVLLLFNCHYQGHILTEYNRYAGTENVCYNRHAGTKNVMLLEWKSVAFKMEFPFRKMEWRTLLPKTKQNRANYRIILC